MREIITGTVASAALILGTGLTAQASPAHPRHEPRVCHSLDRTIEHWWPILLKAKPAPNSNDEGYPWVNAATAIYNYIPKSGHWLPNWEVEVADAIGNAGVATYPFKAQNAKDMAQGISHISYWCSLPGWVIKDAPVIGRK